MGYYQGDHYRSGRFRGDYYRGDPGFFSFIGHALKGLAGTVLPLLPVVGGPASAVFNALTGGGAGTTATDLVIPSSPGAAIGKAMQYGKSLAAGSAVAVPSSTGLQLAQSGGGGIMPPIGTAMMTGGPGGFGGGRFRATHPNRSTYVTRGGGTSKWPQGLSLHPKGSTMVTGRRMNVGNARALRRALRRARGFAKLAHRVLATTRHFKHGKSRKK